MNSIRINVIHLIHTFLKVNAMSKYNRIWPAKCKKHFFKKAYARIKHANGCNYGVEYQRCTRCNFTADKAGSPINIVKSFVKEME